ncbi:MAG: M1 family metallopeptidase [Pyrinomonadaceae bacterium]
MSFRSLLLIVLFSVVGVSAQMPTTPPVKRLEITPNSQTRSIRRDIPLTDSVRSAYENGTRDLSGMPAAKYWQLETDFDIYVRLAPETDQLFGTETITLKNNSPDDLQYLTFRLDHNIFRPLNERGESVPAENTDGMIVTALKINGATVDLNAKMPRRTSRDQKIDNNYAINFDKTVATLVLKNPVKAGSTAKIEFEWSTKLPGGDEGRGHRMTQRWGNRLFQPTQWYPRLAAYDDIGGWETSPYLGPSEFYNNFGKFDVKIEVPEGWLVSATGLLANKNDVLTAQTIGRLTGVPDSDNEIMIVNEKDRGAGNAVKAGDKLVYNYVADRVNDFAWAASKDFLWRATRAEIPGRSPAIINMFYLPENSEKYTNAGKVTRHALQFYSKFSGTYSFPQLTLQDGPSAGMEYPMVINSNQGAADHETFHQWIPMTVGTNETRYAWMDEGFNNYSNIFSEADAQGKVASLDGIGQRYGSFNGRKDEAPLMWNSDYAGSGYRFQAYGKTTFMFSMLGGIVGDNAMNTAIKKYIETWRFKHPSPWDFAFFMNKELGRDLNWFWYYWLFTNDSVDGGIKSVSTVGNETTVDVHQFGQMPSPVILQVDLKEPDTKLQKLKGVNIITAKQAVFRWEENVWFDGSRDFKAKLPIKAANIEKITLDPKGRFPDSDLTDNVWQPK